MPDEGAVRLSIANAAGQLTMAIAKGTLVHRATLPFQEPRVTSAARGLLSALARGARQRALTQACLSDMRTLGEELYRALFPPAIREELSEMEGRPLLLEMDESFVGVPWELVFDGNAFLCRRFDVGRAVSTRLPRRAPPARRPGRPAQMLVVCADPRADLPDVASEGEDLIDVLDRHAGLSVRMVTGRTADQVRAALKSYDFVHFAGHTERAAGDPAAAGWLLAGGVLPARRIAELAGGRPMPLLVFSNACASSQEQPWRDDDADAVYGLASAFLVAGVKYYIGTLYDIVDAQSRTFARSFWVELGRGRSVGAALRRARESVVVADGEAALAWAGYLLYGNPTYTPLSGADAPPAHATLPTPRDIADRESLMDVVRRMRPRRPPPARPPRTRPPWLLALVVILALAGAGLAWMLLR